MKGTFMLMLTVLPVSLMAQNKHNLFADIGYHSSYNSPGGSVTYSRKIAPRLGLGIGGQVFNDQNMNRVKKAAYLDLRTHRLFGKNLLFGHVDAGASFYKGYTANFSKVPGRTFFSCFGLGYGYVVNKRGMGPFVSVKYQTDTYTARGYSPTMPGYESKVQSLDATVVFSAGFKF